MRSMSAFWSSSSTTCCHFRDYGSSPSRTWPISLTPPPKGLFQRSGCPWQTGQNLPETVQPGLKVLDDLISQLVKLISHDEL